MQPGSQAPQNIQLMMLHANSETRSRLQGGPYMLPNGVSEDALGWDVRASECGALHIYTACDADCVDTDGTHTGAHTQA